jgi:hypothetical protein
MNKTVRLALSAVVSGALITAAYSATSASASGDGTRTLRLQERDVRETDLDLGEPGFGPGDQFVFRGKLVWLGSGKRVGTSGGSCTIVALFDTKADAHCNATLRLSDGQISLQAFVTFSEEGGGPAHVAVVGGTGKYRNAHGEAELVDNPDGTTNFTVRLT